jgi:hypothetical protein
VSFGLEGGSESLESPLHEMVEGVWEVVFCIFLVYSMLPLRSRLETFSDMFVDQIGLGMGGRYCSYGLTVITKSYFRIPRILL